jgi:hypothetical protein
MDNLDDLKQIWLTADMADLPSLPGIIKSAKKYRFVRLLKTFAVLFLVLFLIGAMCWVLYSYRSHFISTRVGEAFMFIAMFILLSANIRSLKRISNFKNYSNSEFLSFLKKEKLNLLQFQKTTQKIGFAFASIGLLFYLYEGVFDNIFTMVISYIALLVWCAFMWFILRPLAMKRKTKKLTELILKIEAYSKQLSNDQ